MPGYFGEAEDSARVLADGWLDTGDLGYWCDGELVITGRAKDLIIVNGRNIWPQDIEWAVEALSGLRRGDACAFSTDIEEGEQVVVLVQASAGDADVREALIGNIRQTVRETAGIDCRVELISRRIGLPLTSSGKLSRSRAKAQLLAGAYDPTSRAASGMTRRWAIGYAAASNAVTRAFLRAAARRKLTIFRKRKNYCSQITYDCGKENVRSRQCLGDGGAYGRRQPVAPGARGVRRVDQVLAHFEGAMGELAGPGMGIERVFVRRARRIGLVVADHQRGIAPQLGEQRLGQARIVVPQHADMPGALETVHLRGEGMSSPAAQPDGRPPSCGRDGGRPRGDRARSRPRPGHRPRPWSVPCSPARACRR